MEALDILVIRGKCNARRTKSPWLKITFCASGFQSVFTKRHFCPPPPPPPLSLIRLISHMRFVPGSLFRYSVDVGDCVIAAFSVYTSSRELMGMQMKEREWEIGV